jgi:hypothetical protein
MLEKLLVAMALNPNLTMPICQTLIPCHRFQVLPPPVTKPHATPAGTELTRRGSMAKPSKRRKQRRTSQKLQVNLTYSTKFDPILVQKAKTPPLPTPPSPTAKKVDAKKRKKQSSTSENQQKAKGKKAGTESEALDMLNWMDRLRMEMEQSEKNAQKSNGSSKSKGKYMTVIH